VTARREIDGSAGGGRVHPEAVTNHVETNCAVAREFGYDVRLEDGVLVADGGSLAD